MKGRLIERLQTGGDMIWLKNEKNLSSDCVENRLQGVKSRDTETSWEDTAAILARGDGGSDQEYNSEVSEKWLDFEYI